MTVREAYREARTQLLKSLFLLTPAERESVTAVFRYIDAVEKDFMQMEARQLLHIKAFAAIALSAPNQQVAIPQAAWDAIPDDCSVEMVKAKDGYVLKASNDTPH